MYQDFVDQLISNVAGSGSTGRFSAAQLLHMHAEAARRERVTILELGVNAGLSTRTFLNAIAGQEESVLVSVDIRDCSRSAEAPNWRFVQSDSTDIENVLKSAPILRDGIDIVYFDSLHRPAHVEKEIYGYYPYLNPGAVMFFDDVDSAPYMAGQRKDHVTTEIANRRIMSLLNDVFISNVDDLELTVFYGSTGLARLEKLSPRGAPLAPRLGLKPRNRKLYWKARNLLFGAASKRR